MFYKFVGGGDEALPEIFDKAVVQASVKFGSPLVFNDPFEFKFRSAPPESREAFEAWHDRYDKHRSPEARDNAWDSFHGPGAGWSDEIVPRMNLLSNVYVACLARRWDSHLMWGHYGGAHRGFVIRYRAEVVEALARVVSLMAGPVVYVDEPPTYRWFTDPPNASLAFLWAKPSEWSYEQEHRLIAMGEPGRQALLLTVDPEMIDGVILGARASEALIGRALALREKRPDFSVEHVSSRRDGYGLSACRMDDRTRSMTDML